MFSVEFRYRARKIYKSVKQIVELISNVLLFLASFLCNILVHLSFRLISRLIILMRYTTPIER